MKTRNFKSFASLIMLTLFLASCGGAPERNTESSENIYGETQETSSANYGNILDDEDTESYDIATLVEREPELSIFAELLERSQISLDFAEPVTLLAPTNQAFREIPESHLEHLMNPQNQSDLVRFINRHLLPTERSTVHFNDSQIIETPTEEEIGVSLDMGGDVIIVGGATIKKSNIQASNGIIHIVNRPVEPTVDVIEYDG